LINPLVHGDDVFAKSNYGNGGWAEEYFIATDGTAYVFRAKANTQVDNFACDGTNLYWTEGYGGAAGADDQPTQEVWSAPYTADPTTLDTTATKLADISTGGTVIYAVAFNGFYAVSRGFNGATVIRGSDGSKQQMLPGPGRQYGTLTYVSANELWAIMANGSGSISGIAFQRQLLAAWP
jgi:hypothetical protein